MSARTGMRTVQLLHINTFYKLFKPGAVIMGSLGIALLSYGFYNVYFNVPEDYIQEPMQRLCTSMCPVPGSRSFITF